MKTKEQVLAMKSLTASQKERAQAYFDAQERFHKPLTMPCNNEKEVLDYIVRLEENYKKRKEAEARKRERVEQKKANFRMVANAVNDAAKYGFTINEIIDVINNAVRDKKNAKILAQIEELKAKLV
jgi:transposase